MSFRSPVLLVFFIFFFFNDTATTEIYTLSLHDALPISVSAARSRRVARRARLSRAALPEVPGDPCCSRSEEHTSELQSPCNLVCRLLLEKKKKRQVCMSREQTAESTAARTLPL